MSTCLTISIPHARVWTHPGWRTHIGAQRVMHKTLCPFSSSTILVILLFCFDVPGLDSIINHGCCCLYKQFWQTIKLEVVGQPDFGHMDGSGGSLRTWCLGLASEVRLSCGTEPLNLCGLMITLGNWCHSVTFDWAVGHSVISSELGELVEMRKPHTCPECLHDKFGSLPPSSPLSLPPLPSPSLYLLGLVLLSRQTSNSRAVVIWCFSL